MDASQRAESPPSAETGRQERSRQASLPGELGALFCAMLFASWLGLLLVGAPLAGATHLLLVAAVCLLLRLLREHRRASRRSVETTR
ncbi:MAG: hypothetical protein DWQ36_19305 [Acidobacteria bacterium]|nr:MAG: hypothetical protein DWQ30_06335 [Acidobacteriota bacterium]REK03691.1 MAG: hypothetical protein DWQ36_19305 [Acidobacteriota bacterium]